VQRRRADPLTCRLRHVTNQQKAAASFSNAKCETCAIVKMRPPKNVTRFCIYPIKNPTLQNHEHARSGNFPRFTGCFNTFGSRVNGS
jgi:hypothetical protein